jgi:hypothetical protein
MSSILPFNQIKSGSSVIASPADFVYGTGRLELKGEDNAVTTADGLIHNYRSAVAYSGSCEVRGDKRLALDTAAPATSSGQTWPSLETSLTFEYVSSRTADPVTVLSFSGLISVEYDSDLNKSTINITGSAS